MAPPRVTVCTPTYNRAHTLRVPFESLQAQTFRDFEWILWDDGSTDDTPALVSALQEEATFPMRAERAPNQGKFSAINAAADLAQGELFVILDSDDGLEPHALATFVSAWENLDPTERADLMGVMALCAHEDGRLWGTPLPEGLRFATYLQLRTRHSVTGEKCEALQTRLLREIRYPVFPPERHVPPGFLFVRAGPDHPFLLINEVVRRYEILEDGITANSVRVRSRNAEGYRQFYRAFIEGDCSASWRVRNAVNYLRFSLHKGLTPWGAIAEIRHPAARAAAVSVIGPAVAAWLMDRRRLRG